MLVAVKQLQNIQDTPLDPSTKQPRRYSCYMPLEMPWNRYLLKI
jgi:hypothetical protein